jgi:AcrR family transcriptional regulator
MAETRPDEPPAAAPASPAAQSQASQSPASQSPASPLPPGLDLLWGRRERGKRGPRPGLSTDAIVETAVRVADAEGLDAVSMARVAAEVGFTTMSLYRYVDSKDELLQLMWNASALGAERLVIEGADWRDRLRQWALLQRDMIDRHPWVTQMPMAAPPMAPNSLHFVERGLQTLDGTGLADDDKIRVLGLLSSFTLSEAKMANDAARAAAAAQAAAADAAAAADGAADGAAAGDAAPGAPMSFEGVLRELVDERTYPRLHRLAWTPPAGPEPTEYEQYTFGIDLILDGVQVLIDRSGNGEG